MEPIPDRISPVSMDPISPAAAKGALGKEAGLSATRFESARGVAETFSFLRRREWDRIKPIRQTFEVSP
jgi:hypothetical protein